MAHLPFNGAIVENLGVDDIIPEMSGNPTLIKSVCCVSRQMINAKKYLLRQEV